MKMVIMGKQKMDVAREVGHYIKFYRKQRKMTSEELAEKICKSKSCLSKYENGRIAVDIVTLYEIARALQIRVEQLLYYDGSHVLAEMSPSVPAFFQNLNQFYLYYYDGRKKQVCRCVADIGDKTDTSVFQANMYMNIRDYQHYRLCENTYTGHIYHYDSISCILLQNVEMAMEQYQISIPHPYMNAPVKWGLAYGISSRPLMPTSTKVLVSKEIQEETLELEKDLRLSKEDIRLMKMYNMLTVQ